MPAVASAVLVGMCAGFLPHNFNPARIFMGDTGAMLIGLLLAYGPISSALSLDPNVLVNYSNHPLNRFPTILPMLLPVAILIIPYTDLALAVIRRTARGKSPFSPDRKHLHHRLLNMGHSHRQSVLLMYLWAVLFSGAVVGLSVVRTQVVWLAVVTLAALVALLLATIPQWRPWRGKPARQQPPVPNEPAVPALTVEEPPNGFPPGDYAPGGYVRNGYRPGEYGPASGAYPGEWHHGPAAPAAPPGPPASGMTTGSPIPTAPPVTGLSATCRSGRSPRAARRRRGEPRGRAASRKVNFRFPGPSCEPWRLVM